MGPDPGDTRRLGCIIALEERFFLKDGKPASSQLTSRFWRRYLEVFDSITVLGRLLARENPSAVPIDGQGISFVPLAGYTSPWQYLLHRRGLKQSVRSACGAQASAIVLRVPGAIGSLVWGEAKSRGRPYAVEVVGDPYDVFAPGAVKHPLRPFFRHWFMHQLRAQCAGAAVAAYVTEDALQRRYPAVRASAIVACSDVDLPAEAYAPEPRSVQPHRKSFTLIHVGTMAQLYKAQDVLLDALCACLHQGLDLRLLLIGDGCFRPELEARAARLGLGERARFLGTLPPGEPVRTRLDEADLFVLPSRQEGLPRAMVEAMARGLPCLGSKIGGIPELLQPEDLVPPGDVGALARKVCEVLTSPERMARMSARNLEKAAQYRQEVLDARRTAYYRHVRQETEAWLAMEACHAT